ncbi:MAG: pyridoxal-dependent decarboxylase [Chloroflexota bacterium]
MVDLIAYHLTSLPMRPVFRPVPEDTRAWFASGSNPPEHGQTPAEILADFRAHVEPYPLGNGHPSFFGWVNSPPAVMSVFAEALAAAMNPSVAGGNHAAVHLERQVVEWFRGLLRLPEGSMGMFVSGGSMASLTALAVARHVAARKVGVDVRAQGLQGLAKRFVLVTGEGGHSCLRKSAELLGIGSDQIIVIGSDEHRRMRVAELEEALGRAKREGHVPIAVAATAGTVNTGAIDPLDALADVCARHDVWLHVDAAYGGPALLSTTYAEELHPLARAHSVALDPHKWLYVPVEAGLVLVSDAAAMRDTFSLVPPYLRTDGSATGVGGPPWFSEYGFQQTRGFHALKVWIALKFFGIEGYRTLIDHDIAMADRLAQRISGQSDLDLVAHGLSIVCFRYAPAGLRSDPGRLDDLNKRIVEGIQLGGRAFLTSTMLEGRFVLRACVINLRTTEAEIDALVDLVRSTGAELA